MAATVTPRRGKWAGRVVLVAWCGQCAAEGVRNPSRLGHVEQTPWGTLWVYTTTTSKDRGRTRRIGAFVYIDDGRSAGLPASCPRHGSGGVSTADVIGKRGTIVLDLLLASA
jgi:hypothetical protein